MSRIEEAAAGHLAIGAWAAAQCFAVATVGCSGFDCIARQLVAWRLGGKELVVAAVAAAVESVDAVGLRSEAGA